MKIRTGLGFSLYVLLIRIILDTVGENNISAYKMQNKLLIFPILR